jgi:large subunit ribosomal protein L17
MRHRKKLNHLGRTSSHRKAMLANMASSLILHKRISTTVAKAKALRIYVEPLITKSKVDSTHSRRTVFSYLKDKYAVSELFREVSPKIADRPGGYTRILKTGSRLGDNADMCIIELVDFNENMLASQKETKTAAKRSRRGRSKKAESETSDKQQKPVSQESEEKTGASPAPKKETKESDTVAAKPKEGSDTGEEQTEVVAEEQVEQEEEQSDEEMPEKDSEEKPEEEMPEKDSEEKPEEEKPEKDSEEKPEEEK